MKDYKLVKRVQSADVAAEVLVYEEIVASVRFHEQEVSDEMEVTPTHNKSLESDYSLLAAFNSKLEHLI